MEEVLRQKGTLKQMLKIVSLMLALSCHIYFFYKALVNLFTKNTPLSSVLISNPLWSIGKNKKPLTGYTDVCTM